MKQTVILTALPIEISSGVARIGVFVSPRLETPVETTLQKFEDFLNWPSRLKTITLGLEIAGQPKIPVTIAPTKPENIVPDEGLWDSLFKPATTVRGFAVAPLHTRAIRSFPATNIVSHVSDLHRTIAELSPTGLPILRPGKDNGAIGSLLDFIRDIGQIAGRDQFSSTVHQSKDRAEGMGARLGKSLYGDKKVLDFNGAYAAGNARTTDFALAYAFHDRPGRQMARNAAPFPKIQMKEFEFHEIVASLSNYPEILKRIGLIFEIEVDAAKLGASGRFRMTTDWGAAPAYHENPVHPWTHYAVDGGRFFAQPKAGSDLEAAMLRLDNAGEPRKEYGKDEKRYSLVQIDADGAAMKAVDFAINIGRMNAQNLDYSNPDSGGLPFVSSAGIGLVRHNRAYNLYQRLQTIPARDTAFRAKNETNLYLDDLVRGYRVDILDSAGTWHTVMARDGYYRLTKPEGNYTGPNPLLLSDEGYVNGAAATSDLNGGPDMYLHESMLRWEGWSLVAPRPGKTIIRNENPGPGERAEEPDHTQNTAKGAHVHMEANFRATAKTLPRLRFGERYRIRVRTVDLGGYGPRLDDAPKDAKFVSDAIRYARFEPVAQPFVVLRDKVREGESAEHMVIRSNYDQTAEAYSTSVLAAFNADFKPVNDRWLAPPKVSQLTAETHGMFDELLKQGKVQEAYNLAHKEEGTFLDVSIVNPSDIGNPHIVTGSKILNTPATPENGDVKRKILRESDRTSPNEVIWTRGEPMAPGQYVIHTEETLLLPYLPDPFSRGCAIDGLRDVKGNGSIGGGAEKVELGPFSPNDTSHNVLKIPFDGTWPDRLPFRLVIKERPGTMEAEKCDETFANTTQPPEWDSTGRVLTVYLGKAEMLKLRYSSYMDPSDLETMGIWKWLTGSAKRDAFAKYGAAGLAWQTTPFRELVIVHAVQQPLCAPKILKYSSNKKLGATFATFDGMFELNTASTGRIDVKGRWTEWTDPLNEDAPKQIEGAGQAYHFDLPPTVPNNLPIPAPVGKPVDEYRHEFGDTRYRKIDYYLTGTSRFREYFPSSIWNDPKNITREGKTFTTKVLNSARPAMPKILYIVPTFGWQRPEATEGSEIVSRRCGGGLRVYMDRPWYSSGDEELLGVVMQGTGAISKTITMGGGGGSAIADDSPLVPFVTQWGMDPAWASYPTYSKVQIGHFKSFEASGTALTIDELEGAKVNVVGYTPGYDEVRKLWYCDLEVDTGPSYFPFIRLALARFQPNSVPDAHLSRIVLADFVQLTPDRAASVVHEAANLVNVFVSGVYGMNQATTSQQDILQNMRYSRRMTVMLEETDGAGGPKAVWRPVSKNEVELTPTVEQEFKLKLLWTGRLPLPGPSRRLRGRGTVPGPKDLSAGEKTYRVVFKEWEYFDSDANNPDAITVENGRLMARRLVYADAIEI